MSIRLCITRELTHEVKNDIGTRVQTSLNRLIVDAEEAAIDVSTKRRGHQLPG